MAIDLFERRKIRQSVLKLARERALVEIPAILCNANGVIDSVDVTVLNRQGYVYAKVHGNGQIVQAFNNNVAPLVAGIAVTLAVKGARLWVYKTRDVYAEAIGEGGQTYNPPFDPASATWPGTNTIWIRGEQFLPGLVYPTDTLMQLQIVGYAYFVGGWRSLSSQTVSMTAHVPTSGAYWTLIEVDASGTLFYKYGNRRSGRSNLRAQDVPLPTEGRHPIVAIKSYAGQTSIINTLTDTDILDLRWAGASADATVSGGDMLQSVYDTNEDGSVDRADLATIAVRSLGGNATKLSGTNVDPALTVADGDVLTWNNAAQQWKSEAPGAASAPSALKVYMATNFV